MLARRVKQIAGLKLKVELIVTDPHGELLGLWAQGHLYVLQILSVLKWSEVCRIESSERGNYSWRENIIPLAIITPCSVNEQINAIFFTERGKKGRNLIFVYPKMVEAISLDQKTGSPLHTRIHHVPYQIIHANLVNLILYLPLCNRTLAVVDLRKETVSIKGDANLSKNSLKMSSPLFIKMQRERELTRLDEENVEWVWQTEGGVLMKNKKVISREFETSLQINNSLQQFEYEEQMIRHPVKYELSMCRNYLIGSYRIGDRLQYQQGLYKVRAKTLGWAQIGEFQRWPQINPYWTHFAQYQQQLQGKSDLSYRIVVAEYSKEEKKVTIYWVVINPHNRKKLWRQSANIHKQDQTQTQRQRQKQRSTLGDISFEEDIRYSSKKEVIAELRQLKNDVREIIWLGIAEMMLLMMEGGLILVQLETGLFHTD